MQKCIWNLLKGFPSEVKTATQNTVLARSAQHALSLTMRDDSNDGTNSHLPAVLSFATTMLAWLSWLTCTTASPTKRTQLTIYIYIYHISERNACMRFLHLAVHFLSHLKPSHSGV